VELLQTGISKHGNVTLGSMKGSKEKNHYNIAVMNLMQCRMVMQLKHIVLCVRTL
jgi:hypothetical protein